MKIKIVLFSLLLSLFLCCYVNPTVTNNVVQTYGLLIDLYF